MCRPMRYLGYGHHSPSRTLFFPRIPQTLNYCVQLFGQPLLEQINIFIFFVPFFFKKKKVLTASEAYGSGKIG